LSRPHVEAVLRLGTEGRGEHLLPGGWRAVAGPESVLLVRGEAAAPERPEFRYEVAVPGTTVCGSRASFRTEVVAAGPALDPRSRDNLAVVLDAGAGIPGLEYRNWRPEDRFWPLGGQAAETVRDFLKAQGLAAGERAAVGVVAAPGGEVVWIPGFRVAEGRRVTAKTCTVVRAECTWLSQ